MSPARRALSNPAYAGPAPEVVFEKAGPCDSSYACCLMSSWGVPPPDPSFPASADGTCHGPDAPCEVVEQRFSGFVPKAISQQLGNDPGCRRSQFTPQPRLGVRCRYSPSGVALQLPSELAQAARRSAWWWSGRGEGAQLRQLFHSGSELRRTSGAVFPGAIGCQRRQGSKIVRSGESPSLTAWLERFCSLRQSSGPSMWAAPRKWSSSLPAPDTRLPGAGTALMHLLLAPEQRLEPRDC